MKMLAVGLCVKKKWKFLIVYDRLTYISLDARPLFRRFFYG